MTQQIVNVGAAANDGTGDPARTAFTKCNDNFTELYQRAPHCGRLAFVSATALSFKPFNGNLIKINGVIYSIPSAGIAGLGNTSVFVNGVAGQNLAASTVYYVYAFNNSGVVTADFSTTGRATSTTAGNVGVEIKTGDDTRTLIGMIRTNGSSQFQDDTATRLVLTWFNRRNRHLQGSIGFGTHSSTSAFEPDVTSRTYFLTWNDEAVLGFVGGNANASLANQLVNFGITIDQVYSMSAAGTLQTYAAGIVSPLTAAGGGAASDGFHFLAFVGWMNGGTTSFTYGISGMIRG